MGGFFDYLRMVMGWWSSGEAVEQPILGPACVDAVQTFNPGAQSVQTTVTGFQSVQTFQPGFQSVQTRCQP